MFQILMTADQYPELKRGVPKLMEFASMIIALQVKPSLELDTFYDEVCQDSGYLAMLEAKGL